MADLFALTQSSLAGMEVELVDVERAPKGLLLVTIDRPEGVRIEDCERVSRHLSRVFEVENIDYDRLEVGSPGTDRPLKRAADYIRHVGDRAEIRLREAIGNRRVFKGVLLEPNDAESASPQFGLMFETEGAEPQELRFELLDVERAKLDPVLDFKGRKR